MREGEGEERGRGREGFLEYENTGELFCKNRGGRFAHESRNTINSHDSACMNLGAQ